MGSTLRGDDGWAFYLLERLKRLEKEGIYLLWGETVPENQLAKVERLQPEEVLILDAADLPGETGSWGIFSPQDLKEEAVFSHRFPLKLLASQIEQRTEASVHFLLLRPEAMELSDSLSPSVRRSLRELTKIFRDSLGNGV